MMFTTEEIEFNDEPRLAIKLTEFPNSQFVLDSVKLDEVADTARLCYNYELVGESPSDIAKFEKAIGDFIVYMITERKDELIYKGGK